MQRKHRLCNRCCADYVLTGLKNRFCHIYWKGKMDLAQKVAQKTSDRIWAALKADASLTIARLSAALSIPERTVKYNLTVLKKKGLLRRIGPDKGGHWEIVETVGDTP